MRRRVYVIAGEYSANPRHLRPEQRSAAWLAEPAPEPSAEELKSPLLPLPQPL